MAHTAAARIRLTAEALQAAVLPTTEAVHRQVVQATVQVRPEDTAEVHPEAEEATAEAVQEDADNR